MNANMNLCALMILGVKYKRLHQWPLRKEHSKYAIVSNKPTSIHAAVVLANNNNNNNSNVNVNKNEEEKKVQNRMQHPLGDKSTYQMHKVVASTMAMHAANKPQSTSNRINEASQTQNQTQNSQPNGNGGNGSNGKQGYSYSGINMKGRESEVPETKANMKAMAAKAIRYLAKSNSAICHSITKSRALFCFSVILKKGEEEVKCNSALALKEITAVAEKGAEEVKYNFGNHWFVSVLERSPYF